MISVSISSPGDKMAPEWDELTRRSSPNVFMDPAALNAARETGFSKIHLLMAWDGDGIARKLVGVWALQARKIAFFWPTLLESLPFNYAFLSSPVIDPAFIELVIPAFFAAVKSARSLPNVITMKDLDGEAPSYSAMIKCLAVQGAASLKLSESARPIATRDVGIKKSGSTRKKLRQDWNRLSALGVVDIVNERSPEAVSRAFESFLALEAKGWKGEEGTALLCDREDAAFVRRLTAALADDGHASVALLRLDDVPIAAQVLMYCGSTAYTWKTAYDADYAKYSPGALLIDKITEDLFAKPGIDTIDSCSAEGSFMAQLWTGRRTMIDMLVDVGGPNSWLFRLEKARQHGYQWLRALRNDLRERIKTARSKNPLPAAANADSAASRQQTPEKPPHCVDSASIAPELPMQPQAEPAIMTPVKPSSAIDFGIDNR